MSEKRVQTSLDRYFSNHPTEKQTRECTGDDVKKSRGPLQTLNNTNNVEQAPILRCSEFEQPSTHRTVEDSTVPESLIDRLPDAAPTEPTPAQSPSGAVAEEPDASQPSKLRSIPQKANEQSHQHLTGSEHPADRSVPSMSSALANNNHVNPYELERAERIRRNKEVLKSLGLEDDISDFVKKNRPKPKPKPAVKRKATASPPKERTTRYSLRSANPATRPVETSPKADDTKKSTPATYKSSVVATYVCKLQDQPLRHASSSEVAGSINAFTEAAFDFDCGSLQRVYSVDYYKGMIAAAGQDGYAALFGAHNAAECGEGPGESSTAPLMLSKLHRGWISGVQFVRGSTSGTQERSTPDGGTQRHPSASVLFLSSSNDGTVALWDAAQQLEGQGGGSGTPRCLCTTTTLHTGGVFSLHEDLGRIATASKDGSVCVSELDNSTAIRYVSEYDALHAGDVVKCVRWQPTGQAKVFASCGNDRSICIVDTREPSSSAATPAASAKVAQRLTDAHSTAVNYVRWNPHAPHQLLSTSHDPAIRLFDLRNSTAPVFAFEGHAVGNRCAAIYQPSFVSGGTAVVTGEEKSNCLSLYSLKDGSVISRGAVGFNPTATLWCEGMPCVHHTWLLCGTNRALTLMLPVYA